MYVSVYLEMNLQQHYIYILLLFIIPDLTFAKKNNNNKWDECQSCVDWILNLCALWLASQRRTFICFSCFLSTYEFIRTFFPPALFQRLFSTHLHARFIHVLPSRPTAAPEKKKHLRCGRVLIGSATRRARPRARACEPFRPVFCACTCQREWSLRLPSGPDVGFAARKHKTRKKAKTLALLPATPLTTRCCWISHAGPLNSRPHLSAALRTGTAIRVTLSNTP